MSLHRGLADDPTGATLPVNHLPAMLGTNAQRLAYPTGKLIGPGALWFENDTLQTFQWTGISWTAFGGSGGGPLASGVATLSSGVATVLTTLALSSSRYVLTCQDVDCLGTPRVDNIVEGVSFDINSTGATDDGVVYWQIWST